MNNLILKRWMMLSIFSLFIVATLGMLMRYKIGFSFPYMDQKNLQHAHSHFAFAGWVTQTLFLFIIQSLIPIIKEKRFTTYNFLLGLNWITAAGMLISFIIQGYAFFSIFFSSISIILSFVFALLIWSDIKHHSNRETVKWIKASLLFMVLSSLGTMFLIYFMISKKIDQQTYLASVYWYLHFQYNGWFLFACMGLLQNYFSNLSDHFFIRPLSFKLLAVSCIPAYGLSVLWMKLPLWVEIIIAIATIAQTIGWFLFIYDTVKSKVVYSTKIKTILKWLIFIVAITGSIKIFLQLGSTIPAVSQLAFGFRPIVIAYLHLVLLAFISLILLVYSFLTGASVLNKVAISGIYVFVTGIFLNESLLAVQGIASFSYTLIPQINTYLFAVSVLLFLGVNLLIISQFIRSNPKH